MYIVFVCDNNDDEFMNFSFLKEKFAEKGGLMNLDEVSFITNNCFSNLFIVCNHIKGTSPLATKSLKLREKDSSALINCIL